MSTISEKLLALRNLMKSHSIDAYVIPSGDQHGSEYPSAYWQARAWISTFNGSAGTIIVTMDNAYLWADGRYHTQAEELLKNSPITLFKQGLPGVLSFQDWLVTNLDNNSTVGFDGRQFSVATVEKMIDSFEEKGIKISTMHDLVGEIWMDRPNFPLEKNFDLPLSSAGKTRADKINDVLAVIEKADANTFLLTSLDDIAWLFNIRLSNAMPAFGQVFAVISRDERVLFASSMNVVDVKNILEQEGIKILPYEDIFSYVKNLPNSTTIYFDPASVNWNLYHLIPEKCQKVEGTNPTKLMKSMKNEVEIKNSRHAHLKDGIAMTKFLYWLEQNVHNENITEYSAGCKLDELRWAQPDSFGPSFNTIAGYGPNGAMMHYSAKQDNTAILKPEGFFLVDSGGQYLDGLTDTTRTIALGGLSDDMKLHYTLALKGLIALSMAKFPKGTKGCNLDVLARQPLWELGLDYRCGTGHGVGYFLNVHEGPQGISQALSNVPLDLGQMTTIEPGFYAEGKYGIRIENIVLTVLDKQTEYGDFYKFDYLTLCPIDLKPVIKELLTSDQIAYLNDYHADVFAKLSAHLEADEVAWLKLATKAI
ncbi:MAG: aminopeptidase P family protein [Lentisphaeria bacterium]